MGDVDARTDFPIWCMNCLKSGDSMPDLCLGRYR